MIELGLALESTPPAVMTAYRRGNEIHMETYDGAPCCLGLEDAGDDWRIRVTRVSDGDVTTDLIPKD